MRTSSKRMISVFLAMLMTLSLFVHGAFATSEDYMGDVQTQPILGLNAPRQVNAHFGADASTEINLTYTTLEDAKTKIVYNKEGETETFSASGTKAYNATAKKYFHSIGLTGLSPDTWYEYTAGDYDTYSGRFKTAPAKGGADSVRFAYMADIQVSTPESANAAGATLKEAADGDFDFIYFAGDMIDTPGDFAQWERMFSGGGLFPNSGQDLFGNNTIAVVRGNHDNSTFNGQINVPQAAGTAPAVYSFEYGPATFVMLSVGESNSGTWPAQKAYLEPIVADAKERGQWVVVCFHIAIYTGGRHLTDEYSTPARKFWSPVLAELDVDLVLQGHDHVFSRGFVKGDGKKAIYAPKFSTVQLPENAPLYVVGGQAGGTKWYGKQRAYTVGAGDPLLPNYAFLDVNSVDDGSEQKEEQWITEIEITADTVSMKAYAFKYDMTQDEITTEKYLYDSLTVTRDEVDPIPEPTVPEIVTNSISQYGDSWYTLAGLKGGSFVTDSFDMSKLDGWNLVTTPDGFNSEPSPNPPFIYYKKTFELGEDFDVDDVAGVSGTHFIDDGLLIYLNGIEVYRFNTAAGNAVSIGRPIDWGTFTLCENTNSLNRDFAVYKDFDMQDSGYQGSNTSTPILYAAGSLTNLKAALKPGTNVITCVVLQRNSSSSDLWFNLKMELETEKKELRLKKGDVNRDGEINLFDLLAIRDHIFGKITLEGGFFEAADIDGDEILNIFDIMAVRDHILGKKIIDEYFILK